MKNDTCVVLTTYNGEKYICEQIESIINQTRKIGNIYIFDDCSTDNTISIINCRFNREIESGFIILSINDTPKGWKKNFFDGLSSVNENYVFISDQDDIWENDKVELMINEFYKNPNIGLLASSYELLYSDENSTKEKENEKRRIKDDMKLHKVKKRANNLYIRRPGCTYCIKNDLLKKYLTFWNDNLPHDSLLWKMALFEEKLYCLNIPLIKWRRHSNNATKKTKETYKTRLCTINSDYEFISNSFFEDKFINKVKRFYYLRKKMYENSILYWFLLFFYIRFYVSFKSYLGDLIIYFRR